MGWDAAPGMQKQSTGVRWGWGERDKARTQPQGQAAGMLPPFLQASPGPLHLSRDKHPLPALNQLQRGAG